MKYEAVIGLEVHLQLTGTRKIFAPETFIPNSPPNSNISAVSYAHPGALPFINQDCLLAGLKLGVAIGAKIQQSHFFARKNYFYPDLPKGYQITQDSHPFCIGGTVPVYALEGRPVHVQIHHIHLEEDAGKSIHDRSESHSFIDLNRAGTGLLEIVTEPVMHDAETAAGFVMEIRKIARFLTISNADMEKGNLRCDANISIRPEGSQTLGTRVEIKNINSFSFLRQAIHAEIERQTQLLSEGKKVRRETRSWDANRLKTVSMREKEAANDYRYFPDPDLPMLGVLQEDLDKLTQTLPELPYSKYLRYTQKWEIPHNESLLLSGEKPLSDYFEAVITHRAKPSEAANWVLGPVRGFQNANGLESGNFPLNPDRLAELILLVRQKKVSFSIAKERIFPKLCEGDQDPMQIAQQGNWLLQTDEGELIELMKSLMESHPEEVNRFRKGKKGLAGFFVGKIMRETQGKSDPKTIGKIVNQLLNGG